MNTISFTPNYGISQKPNYNLSSRIAYNAPSFKGKEKVVKDAKPEPVLNFMKQLYGLFFTFGEGKVKSIKDGSVFTETFEKNGRVRVSKKFGLFSRKPQMAVEDDFVMKMRKRTKYNPDGSQNIEFRDMHQPEYRVSVSYENVTDPVNYDGPVKIHYLDKEVTVSPQKKKELIKELDKALDNIQSLTFPKASKMSFDEVQEYLAKYYKNPDLIGSAILTSPLSMQKQLSKVHESMPYGIEAILSKLEG